MRESMANNRMYLRCTLCGERFYLAKYYPSTGWYTNQGTDPPEPGPARGKENSADFEALMTGKEADVAFAQEWFDRWQDFLDQHSPCVRRGPAGKYAPVDIGGTHMLHGTWPPERDFTITHLGQVFKLEYE